MLKKHLYIFVAVLCLAILASGAGIYASSSQMPPSAGSQPSVPPSVPSSLSLPASVASDRPLEESSSAQTAPSSSSSGVPIPPQQLEAVIHIADGQTLVLGADGKFLLRTDGGAASEIPETEWETPTGYYDAGTKVILDGATAFVRSVVAANIDSMSGAACDVTIVAGSNIAVATGASVGVDVGRLAVSSMEGTTPTLLKISAVDVGIRFLDRVMLGPFTTLEVSALLHGAQYVGEDYTSHTENFVVYHGSVLNIQASGVGAVAMVVDGMKVDGANVTLTAPSGTGGIKALTELSIHYANGYEAVFKATSALGRAISCAYLDIYGAQVSGITPGGEIGIMANSYINIQKGEDSSGPSKVYGSAHSGYGIVGQNIDDGDSEYPSGSINLQYGTLEGRVNEGMGISTNTFYVYNNEAFVPRIEGIAQAGVGISACMLNLSGEVFIRGVSHGASSNHYQVYGAIPDCAGINALSYVNLSGNITMIAEAPKDVVGSYGLHCFLPYEGGYASGSISLGGDPTTSMSIKASGETGIYTPRLYSYSAGAIEAIGSKDGIVVEAFTCDLAADTSAMKINAKGERGSGMKVQSEWEGSSAEFSLKGVELNAVGGEFGIFVVSDIEIAIINSIVNVRAEGPLAVAGAYISASQKLEAAVRPLKITDSYLYAYSPNYGWFFKDLEVEISAAEYSLPLPGQMKGEGHESGIKLEYSEAFLPEYQSGEKTALSMLGMRMPSGESYTVWGVSFGLEPDKAGRSSAVSMPSCKIDGGGVLYEEYTSLATGQLTANEAYPVYARGMNIEDFTGYAWSSPQNLIIPESSGLIAEGVGNFAVIVTGERQSIPARVSTDMRLVLVDGVHRVQLITDISIGTVHYNANGGTPAMTSVGVAIGREIPAPPAVTRPGFELTGWKNLETQQIWHPGMLFLGRDQIELEAQWVAIIYTVTFDANAEGAVVENMPPENPLHFVAGDLIPTPHNTPQRVGADFKYWALDPAGNGIWKFDSDMVPTDNIVLYAIWGPKEYNIVYSAVGGSPQEQVETVAFGNKPLVNVQEPTRDGFAFDGWYTDMDTTALWDSSAPMPANDFTVYTGWKSSHVNIIFDIDGGHPDSAIEPLKVKIGSSANLAAYQPGAIEAPYYDGHFFMGWMDDSGNVVFDAHLVPEHDVHLKARWQQAVIEPPKAIVAYRNTKTAVEVENELQLNFEYEDLLGRMHKIAVQLEWDSNILSRGGIGDIGIRYVDANSRTSISYESIKIYVLNHAVITSQEKQIFAFGQDISQNGAEWGPVCYAEVPDFDAQTIKQISVPLTFMLRGTDIRTAGTYYPEFSAIYTDYLGKVKTLNRLVVAIVLPQGGGEAGATLKYWQTVASKMLDESSPNHMFLSAANYGFGGDTILFAPNYFSKRILARPGPYTMMTAEALQALKGTANAQLQVDLGWLQWYFNTQDFANGAMPAGIYPLDARRGSEEPWLKNFANGRNAMLLQFAMNKQWNGTPTLQLQVDANLQKSATDGKELYMFWFNTRAHRLELVGRMENDTGGDFSIRMDAVNQNYIILDELPLDENNKPAFVISDKTNPIDDKLQKVLEDMKVPEIISNIHVGTPQEYEKEKTNMISMYFPSVLCIIIIVILLLIIALLIYFNHRLRKKLREANGEGELSEEPKEVAYDDSFAKEAGELEDRMFGESMPEDFTDALRAQEKEGGLFGQDIIDRK